jgi:hypothetical protein
VCGEESGFELVVLEGLVFEDFVELHSSKWVLSSPYDKAEWRLKARGGGFLLRLLLLQLGPPEEHLRFANAGAKWKWDFESHFESSIIVLF